MNKIAIILFGFLMFTCLCYANDSYGGYNQNDSSYTNADYFLSSADMRTDSRQIHETNTYDFEKVKGYYPFLSYYTRGSSEPNPINDILGFLSNPIFLLIGVYFILTQIMDLLLTFAVGSGKKFRFNT